MRTYIISLVVLLVIALLVSVIPAFAARAASKWYVAGSIENSGGSFGGLKYQKIVDDELKVVCYTATGVKQDVSISCVKR